MFRRGQAGCPGGYAALLGLFSNGLTKLSPPHLQCTYEHTFNALESQHGAISW